MPSDDIESLRVRIRELDQQIVDLAAKRTALARRVGELKAESGSPIRNYVVEAEVIRLARERAAADALSPDVAEEVVKILIRESLHAQELDRRGRTRASLVSNGKMALVIGGAGSMGRWFAEFLDSKGFSVSIADSRGTPNGYAQVRDVAQAAHAFDLILIATPPSAVAGILKQLHGRTTALVFEIGSLKSPFLAELREFASAGSGAAVTSVHPMWGPQTELLASKNVIICDCGNAEANRAAKALFEDTAANVFEMRVEEHDRYMASVLGLPHAVNLIFGQSLARNGLPLSELAHLGGPTFQKQLAIAREVASENKDLYFEIQKLNPHTREVLTRLRRSLDEFEQAVSAREAFRTYMGEAERFFDGDSP
ncbi:MAG: bifunctional chorismate mutase/prephenate dehydrogenase [Candidatus Thermoplasmatota archaeon]